MRSPCVPLIAAAAFCAGSLFVGTALAQKAKPDPFVEGPVITSATEGFVRFEVFALPLDAARRAQRQFLKQADLYAWLEAEMEKPAPIVKLERMDILRVRDGQRAKLELIDEYPYPTEFDPPQIPQTVGIGMPATARPDNSGSAPPPVTPPAAAPPGSNNNNGAKGDPNIPGRPGSPAAGDPPALPPAFPNSGPPGSIPARSVPPWPYTQTTPSAFATKNTGWTYEVEVSFSDEGDTADINISPEFIKPAGTESTMINGEETQPIFETRKISTQMDAVLGKPAFAGTFSRPVATGAGGAEKEESARLLFITITPATVARPDDAEPEDELNPHEKPEAFIRLEAISLPPAAARKAWTTHRWETDLYNWLDSELTRKDSGVSLEHASTMRVRGDRPSKNEATVSYPYATELDPPQISQSISLPQGLAAIPIPGTSNIFTPWPSTPTSPGSFSSRNLGWTTELKARFGPGRAVDLDIVPENTRIVDKVLFGAFRDVAQPVFESQKFHGKLATVTGRPSLLSTFTPPTGTEIPNANTSDRVWFLFATVTMAE